MTTAKTPHTADVERIEANPPADEPCALCQRETGIRGLLHAGRRRIADLGGRDIFVCADCEKAARASRGGDPLSDQDLHNFVRAASLAGITWGRG